MQAKQAFKTTLWVQTAKTLSSRRPCHTILLRFMALIIPPKLIEMTRARRVIPFVGAGFSSSLNLPDWDSLLTKLAHDIDSPIPHDQVKEFCHNDPLQIAEYYLLISDGRVGPLRHAISTALQTTLDPLMSGMHVELVNLGAAQIYTTNFDDLIEQTFKTLKQPVEVISLPKHLATSSDAKSQVIKYHGDLRHEQTLVLTESSYYARLDLESPMDIKFRSDLLGRSVLFMGYSFRDINIRIIWFRLMRMMKDIRQEDRPTSFIVTFTPNPVLQKLYEAVGIDTICLAPSSKTQPSPIERTKLLNDFLLRLVAAASQDGHIIGRPTQQLIYSQAITDAIEAALHAEDEEAAFAPYAPSSQANTIQFLLAQAGPRFIPPCHQNAVKRILALPRHFEVFGIDPSLVSLASNYAKQFGQDTAVTTICAKALERARARNILFKAGVNWKVIWGAKFAPEVAQKFIERFEGEFQYHEDSRRQPDSDLAYMVDVAKRILNKEISDLPAGPAAAKLEALLRKAGQMYSEVERYDPKPGNPPEVEPIITQIEASSHDDRPPDDDDDVPF